MLAKSSNIGALKIALALGEPGLYSAYRRFGFGEPTGLPLPGEASGVLRPKGRAWFDVETANASFGQGISVTTVQLAQAMSAIANGGKLVEVPASVAKMVAEMLTAVVEEGGTGVEASMTGFRVAGKTATAQKVDPATGKYSEDKYTASFVGFVPAEKPRLVVAVVLDEPMIGRYGGDLAGPVFRRVAEASLRHLGVPPSNVQAKVKGVAKNADAEAASAAAALAATAAKVEAAEAEGDKPATTTVTAANVIGPPAPNGIKVPDAVGMGARSAMKAIGAAGLVPVVEGTGRLVRQIPVAGAQVPKGSPVRLVFEPAS